MTRALDQQRCVPCQSGVAAIPAEQAEQMLAAIPGWSLDATATRLKRSFVFQDFMQAQAFAVRVGELAESENHHPDISYGWAYCTVLFFTHKIGGLHDNDFIMAAKVNAL